jgi:hypothetical protein
MSELMQNIRTSPKKARKPQSRTLPLRNAILSVAADYEQMTVRQLYYQLVSRGVLEKTEQAYKRVCDISAQMRLNGSLPYRKIADGSRARWTPYAFGGLTEALEITASAYRRNIWIDQDAHVEIWCEKDALTGVIKPICDEYCVPYVATRGFPSLTLLYESAMEMIERGKPTALYYFGDHDASGQAISVNLEEKMRAHGADVRVQRVGLLQEHIAAYDLPTRPSKTSDKRTPKFAAQYGDACVELDALPPHILTRWVEESIIVNLDRQRWRKTLETEALEKETYESLAQAGWKPGHLYDVPDDDEGDIG